jgi:hypothetical protein
VQPHRLHGHVVIRECDDLASSIPDAGVTCGAQALLWFIEIAETAGIPATKVLDYVARLVAGVVVHDKHFPFDPAG